MKRNKRGALAYRDAFLAGRVGIRARILLRMAWLVSFIIALIWICQIALLFGFYQNYRTGQVRSAADTIIKNLDRSGLEELADRISAENEICMLIRDEEGTEILSIDHVRFCLLHHMSSRELKHLAESVPPDGTEHLEMRNVSPFRNERYRPEEFEGPVPENEGSTGRSLLYTRKVFFGDGTTGTLMINAQITPTGTILSMLRRQFIYLAILILTVACIMGYRMAWSIARPIIETNTEARRLSRGEYERPAHSGEYLEIAELNDTLVQAADDLKKIEVLERELIANISHDLRTPLTMIQGYAETMRDIPDEMNPENMQVIVEETQRLSSLVNEVLEFSRMRTGNLQLEIGEFDLTETVRMICARVSAMTEKDGYHILCEAESSCRVLGDSGRIEQVVYNLLGNALTYTGEDKRVILRQEDRGSRIRVCVQDTGKGIAASEMPHIWERYYRTKESHKRAVIGSGLGLNICRGILESHHAPYGVESVPGEGATFWFELEKA